MKKKKTQNRKFKNGFQPLPFFIAMAAMLPIHTSQHEQIVLDSNAMMAHVAIQTTKPAQPVRGLASISRSITGSMKPSVSNTKIQIGNLPSLDKSLTLSGKLWQLGENTIDLLYFHPEHTSVMTTTESSPNEL